MGIIEEIVKLFLSSIGLGYITWVLVYSRVFDNGRRVCSMNDRLCALLKCPFCMGWWCAAAWQCIFQINPLGCGWLGIIGTIPILTYGCGYIAAYLGSFTKDIVEEQRG